MDFPFPQHPVLILNRVYLTAIGMLLIDIFLSFHASVQYLMFFLFITYVFYIRDFLVLPGGLWFSTHI